MCSEETTRWPFILVVKVFTLLLVVSAGAAVPGERLCQPWTRVMKSEEEFPIEPRAVAFGDGRFVAVQRGRNNEVYQSHDGKTWNRLLCFGDQSFCFQAHTISDLCWEDGRFLAVSSHAHKHVFEIAGHSYRIISNDLNHMWGVAWNGSYLVAVGQNRIATSVNGETWDVVFELEFSSPIILRSVCWTDSQWVAVGGMNAYEREGFILASADGAEWALTKRTPGADFQSVAAANGRLVAVGDRSFTSSDGVSWLEIVDLPSNLNSVDWVGDRWIAVGDAGLVFESQDGVNWEKQSELSGTLLDVVGTPQVTVVVGDHLVASTSDHINWTETTTVHPVPGDVIWDGTRFLAAGYEIFASEDGSAWRKALDFIPNIWWNGLAWNGSLYVAVGGDCFHSCGSAIFTSPDGRNWAPPATPDDGFPGSLYSVVWTGEFFATVGHDRLMTSHDGVVWQAKELSAWEWGTRDILWDGEQLVILSDGAVTVSVDGEVWSEPIQIWEHPDPNPNTLSTKIATDGTRYVVVGDYGRIATSDDLLTWTQRLSGTERNLTDVIWTGAEWYAASRVGEILWSADGVDWFMVPLPREPPPPENPGYNPWGYTLGYNDRTVIAIGENEILQTRCGPVEGKLPDGRAGTP